MEIALGAGAEDIKTTGNIFEITCDPAVFDALKNALKEKGIPIELAEISMLPQSTVPVTDAETARKVLALMEDFEDHDDVQNVYANFDIPDDIIAKLETP